MDKTLVRNALQGMIRATDDDSTPIIRRLARIQARAALENLDAETASGAGEREGRFWLIVREPGNVPERKGPWPHREVAHRLREFIAARPRAFIDVLTIGHDGTPEVEHGPEVLQYTDGRSMSVGRKHNQRVRDAAEEALASLPPATDPAMVTALRNRLVDKEVNWLVHQLEAWPNRVDPDRTTNIQWLMQEAARIIRSQPLAAAPTIPATGEAVPAGMKAWHGGGAAPSDWDGGKVLFRDGKIEPYSHKDHICWCHKEPNPSDIIAYTTNATTPATGHAATEGEGA